MGDAVPKGVFCAALTPVADDLSADVPALAEHCRWLIAEGCDGVALLGTTGEANSFSVAERMRLLERVVEAGVPAERLLPGTGCAALSDTVELSRHATGLGVAGVVMLPPFYYKDVTVDGLFASYDAVIDRVGDSRLKLVLYHIPPIAQVPIPMALIERLRERYPDTVVGIKDSGGDLAHMVELVRRFPGLAVLAGADPLLLPLLRAGGAGCITATSNLAARDLATIYAGWRDPRRKDEVEAAQARVTELRARVSRWPQIAALKAATALRTGRPGWSRPRPPLVALTPAEQEALRTALAAPLPGAAEPDRSRLAPATDDPARLEAFLPSSCVQNHAANLMPLQNGDIACVWFGGRQEGMPDISIYFARLEKGAGVWAAPVQLSDDPTRSEQNPVLFPAPDGRLWLIFTAQRSGSQDTAIVRYRISEDDGLTWGPIGTLFDRPGTFVRQPVLVLDNGEWLLPIFYSRGAPGRKWVGDHDVSAVKISADEGRTWMEYPVPNSTGCVHMNVAQLGDGTLLALVRSRWADRIHASRSTDRGRTWSAPVPTELPNNNSSIQFTRLQNGHLALVFNDVSAEQATERRVSLYDEIEDDAGDAEPRPPEEGRRAFWGAPRAPLTLAISTDEGKTWPRKRNIEVGDGYCMTNNSEKKLNRELSYPSIKQTADRRIHIAFTYFRQAIKHVSVTEDWVGRGA